MQETVDAVKFSMPNRLAKLLQAKSTKKVQSFWIDVPSDSTLYKKVPGGPVMQWGGIEPSLHSHLTDQCTETIGWVPLQLTAEHRRTGTWLAAS